MYSQQVILVMETLPGIVRWPIQVRSRQKQTDRN